MRFSEALPIIEGKLYSWAEWRQHSKRPSAAISSVYKERVGHVESPERTSPQERWMVRHAAMIYEAEIIEDALGRCTQEQKELAFRRYAERQTWEAIAEALHVSQREVYRVRDQVLAVVGVSLGLWHQPKSP